MTRLINAEELKDHKFAGNKYIQIGGRTNGKILEAVNRAYQQGWNDAIDAIADNAPPIETAIENLICTFSVEELKATTGFIIDTPSGEAISFRREHTGHWIKEDEQNLCGWYRCSECGRRVEDLTDDIKIHAGCEDFTIADIYPYCHCGAKMKQEEENENS